MVPDVSRRSFASGVVGALGIGALGYTTYQWQQYSRLHSTRNHLRFRPLRGVNQSDEPITLDVTVYDDGSHVYDQSYDLGRAGDDHDEKPMNGPWVKSSGEYSVHVETSETEYDLEHDEIISRLDGMSCQGSDDVAVTVLVTEERTLESTLTVTD